jgi:hypothetical protein
VTRSCNARKGGGQGDVVVIGDSGVGTRVRVNARSLLRLTVFVVSIVDTFIVVCIVFTVDIFIVFIFIVVCIIFIDGVSVAI